MYDCLNNRRRYGIMLIKIKKSKKKYKYEIHEQILTITF